MSNSGGSTERGPYLERICTAPHRAAQSNKGTRIIVQYKASTPAAIAPTGKASAPTRTGDVADPGGRLTAEFKHELRHTLGKVVQEELKPPKPIVSKQEQDYFRNFHETHVAPRIAAAETHDGITSSAFECSDGEVSPIDHDLESPDKVGSSRDVAEANAVTAEAEAAPYDNTLHQDAPASNSPVFEEHSVTSTVSHKSGRRPGQARRTKQSPQRQKVPYSDTELFKSLLAARENELQGGRTRIGSKSPHSSSHASPHTQKAAAERLIKDMKSQLESK